MEALETFCRLRIQSVSGQLSGAIPSTEEGQAAFLRFIAAVE